MTGCAMKSEAIGTDRNKTEGRQSIHRWRMSKIPPIVNGAEDNVGLTDGEEIMVRQANPVNIAAAVHDHISCTKSAEPRKISETKDGRVNLPLTDHMYANYSEKPKGLGMIATVSPIPPEIKDHVRCLEEIVLSQLNLIGKQNETICNYEKKIEALGKELNELSKRVDECDDRMCIVKNDELDNGSCHRVSEVQNNLPDMPQHPSVSYPMEKRCLTKCWGRSPSKHPSRSLKRRNMVLPDKSPPCKRISLSPSSSELSISASPAKKEDEKTVEATTSFSKVKTQPVPVETRSLNFKKVHKKRGRKPRISTWKDDFLHTDKPYFLPDYYSAASPLSNAETTIDVPSWRKRNVPSFYQMEGTENIDDRVFQKRHDKYEKEEKRRKKRDLQQQREMQQQQQRKQYRGMAKDSRGKLRKKSISLYPSPNDIEYIEVTDSLPVIAFGHLIPVFQPSEFSLPWSVPDPVETMESSGRLRMARFTTSGQKVT